VVTYRGSSSVMPYRKESILSASTFDYRNKVRLHHILGGTVERDREEY
jgi:hypothetical protein